VSRRLAVAGRIAPREIGASYLNTGIPVRVVELEGETPDGFVWKGIQYVDCQQNAATHGDATGYALTKLFRSAAHLIHQEWKR
jgi:hypothetical protein